MLDQALHWLENMNASNGVIRALWLFLVLTVLAVGFEAQTNYFEINAISKRLEVLEKASQQPLTAEQTTRIERLKNGVLAELEGVQSKRANPFNQFLRMAGRFIKGAWVSFPLFLVVIGIASFFLKNSKTENLQVRGMMVYFGWLGLSVVAWITTMLGLNSVLWNSSENWHVSWFVFPVCSALALVVIVVWVMMLRTLLPKETKPKPAAAPVVSTQEQTE
jgi:hypothetical protein